MSKQTLGGFTLDLLTPGELHKELVEFHKAMTAVVDRERSTDQDVSNQATANAAGVADLVFQVSAGAPGAAGGPSASQVWDVRRIAIGASPDAATIIACVGRLYKREVSPLTLLDFAVQVPTVATYSRHQLTLKPGEALIFRATGLASGQVIAGMAQVEQTTFGARQQYTL